MREFILARSAFNHTELARLISWSSSSFHQWLQGYRPIPKGKSDALRKVLTEYGYQHCSHIQLEYVHSENGSKPYVAYAKNTHTGKRFLLGRYSTEEKRITLAHKLLNYLLTRPSPEFKRFINTTK